jgi:hypothetical protein
LCFGIISMSLCKQYSDSATIGNSFLYY